MATLAGSLRNLFAEIDLVWPERDRRTDGWIGDAAHQAQQSDHNPDSRGIVHAIDIDIDGVDASMIINAAARDEMPTNYIVYNRRIWKRSRYWEDIAYTGDNPHTDHIHVSILHGVDHESDQIHWGLVDLGGVSDIIVPAGEAEEMGDWHAYIDRASGQFMDIAWILAQSSASLDSMTG